MRKSQLVYINEAFAASSLLTYQKSKTGWSPIGDSKWGVNIGVDRYRGG